MEIILNFKIYIYEHKYVINIKDEREIQLY